MRHTTFRFALAPTPAQTAMLARHAGASRFAYNQCLRLVVNALAAKQAEPQVEVPWSRFDLINASNAWKRSEAAGRIFVAAPDGTVTKQVTGLVWRREVSGQVFEEAAVDLGRALSAYAQAKTTDRGRQLGFPRWKRKGRCRDSFRLRNKHGKGGRCSIRVGEGHSRCVTLPTIGVVRVHDDTRRLRRLLRPGAQLDPATGQPRVAPRAKILFATVTRHGSRWYVSLNVLAPDLHANRRHLPRPAGDDYGFVGVDRGLIAFAVAATADGTEVGRFEAPMPLHRAMVRLRRLSRRVSATRPRWRNRTKKAVRCLSRQHARITNIRRHFLHEVSSQLIQTHDRLCLEDLTVANLIINRRLTRAIGDVAWAEFARQLTYKSAWFGTELVVGDRWFASTKTCSRCGVVKRQMRLAERTFRCASCGLVIDRDRNAAVNLAAWAERSHARAPDRQAGSRVIKAPGGEGAGHRPGDGGTSPREGGTDAHAVVA